jgi:hypothetical protein
MKYQPITEFDPLPIRDVLVGYWCGDDWLGCIIESHEVEVFPEYEWFCEIPERPSKPEVDNAKI